MSRKKGDKPSIYDIAKESGVSVATVSRVMNHPGTVSAEKETLVTEAMERLGVKSLNRTSAARDRGIIVLDYPVLKNPFYSAIEKGIYAQAKQVGYSVMQYLSSFTEDHMDALEKLARKKDVVGFITVNRHDDKTIRNLNFIKPVVQCLEFFDPVEKSVSSVTIDMDKMADIVMDFLVKNEIRRIGAFDYTLTCEYGRKFLSSMKTKAFKNGIFMPEEDTFFEEPGYERAYADAVSYIMREDHSKAIICAGDDLAIGAYKAARKCNIDVPGEMMITGAGGMNTNQISGAKIMSVSGMGREAGRIACHKLISEIKNPYQGQSNVRTKIELVPVNSNFVN